MKKSKFLSEFKEFISRGNAVDLAVGLIVGAAFSAIVSSLVNDIVMPLVGFLFGGVNFRDLRLILTPAVEGVSEEVAIRYGAFLQSAIDFVLISLVVFLMVKGINSFRKKIEEAKKKGEAEEEAVPEPAEPSDEIKLLTEIRDLMKK